MTKNSSWPSDKRDLPWSTPQYFGLSKKEAIDKITSDGYIYRIAGIDGKNNMMTAEFDYDRINIVLSNGQVVSAYKG